MTPTHTHHQLDDLRNEWRHVGRSRSARDAAEILKSCYPFLHETRAQDLFDVVELLEPRSGLSQDERAHLAAALLRACPEHPLLARTMLQTMLPGLIAVARRLDWGRGRAEDPSSFLADLITAAYEVIAEWGGQERPYAAPDLLNAVRCRMRRRLIKSQPHREVSLELLEEQGALPPSATTTSSFDEFTALLRHENGELDPIGAATLYGREVLGLTYKELAEMTGISTRRLAAAEKAVARRILA